MDLTNNLINSNTTITTTTSSSSLINPPKRVRIDSDDWIDKVPRSRVLERWKEQDLYIDYLEVRLHQLQQSIESNELLRDKETECKKLKSMLNYRFLTKTTQQQSVDQMRDMMQTPSLARLRQTYLDPSVNLIYGQMREEIERSRKARDEAKNELHAWQFTADSKNGKMLMARCKKLLEENEQLGKIVSSDNVAKLEGEIALQNRLLTNIKDAQKDYEEIMLDMDTNMDAMSSTLLHMRHQLSDSHRQITSLNEENARLRASCPSTTTTTTNLLTTPNGTTHTDSSSIVSTTNTNTSKLLLQKRPHSSNRTTQNIIATNKLKTTTTTTNLYDTDQTISPPPSTSYSSNEIMDVDANALTSISTNSTNNNTNTNTNTNTNEHLKRTNSLENGIDVTP